MGICICGELINLQPEKKWTDFQILSKSSITRTQTLDMSFPSIFIHSFSFGRIDNVLINIHSQVVMII